jgi:hypothetical protein
VQQLASYLLLDYDDAYRMDRVGLYLSRHGAHDRRGVSVEKADYQRVRARVVRAGPYTAHVAIGAFASGQITIPVPTRTMTDATGPARQSSWSELRQQATAEFRFNTFRFPSGMGSRVY